VYCSVEKVASTGMKMFIRSLRKLPGIGNYFRTHTPGYNGLKYLWPHYKGWSKRPAARVRCHPPGTKVKFIGQRAGPDCTVTSS